LFLRCLNLSGHGLDLYAGAIAKVFCFFSSEKKTFLRKHGACELMSATTTTVLIIGGCAAEDIKRGLSSAPAATARYRFTDLPVHRGALDDPAALALISAASHIFVQQPLGVDTGFVRAHAAPNCLVTPFPSVVMRSLWPFESDFGHADEVARQKPEQAIRHHDGALARLRQIEPDKKKRLQRYRDLDFPWARRIDSLAEAQRRFLAHIDTLSHWRLGDFVIRNFRERQLFYDASHPGAPFYQEVCKHFWRILDLPGVPDGLTGIDSWRMWSVPVHPGVARRLGVGWAHEATHYHYCTLGNITWAEWAEHYIDIFG
jgi:hypothetical protein